MRTKFLKQTIIIAVSIAFFTSCSPDECTQEYNVSVVQSRLATSTITLSGMTGNVTLNPSDATNGEIQTTGDVNLNGYRLKLVNVRLTVNGTLNGGGKVRTQGANGAICVIGNIQNNPNTQGVVFNCGTLSTPTLVAPDTIRAECGLSAGDVVEIDGIEYRIQY